MGTMAKRRTAAAATVLFLILYLFQLVVTAAPARATNDTTTYLQPNPAYVDAAPGWAEIGPFAPLTRAGVMPPNHDGGPGTHEADLYLAYDCETSTMYARVLAQPGVTIDETGDHFIKIEEFPESGKVIDDGTGDFAYIYDEDVAVDWTGSFTIVPGSYNIDVHTQVVDGGSQTASTNTGNSTIPLEIKCENGPTGVMVWVEVGSCTYDTGKGSQTPVTVTINPESGAVVTIYDFPDHAVGEFTGAGGSINLPPGEYSWDAMAEEGYTPVGASSGEFTVGECVPSTTASTTTTTTTTTTLLGVAISAACPTEGLAPLMKVDPAGGATVTLTDVGNGVWTWTAVANQGYAITSGATGEFDTTSCADVLGTTIISTTSTSAAVLGTTVAAVTASTLPFTGFELERTFGLALATLMVGAGLLLIAYGAPERKVSTIASRW